MDRIFFSIYTFFKSAKLLFFGFLILYVLGFGFLASKLSFEEDISKLIPISTANKTTAKVLENINFADKIVVLLAIEDEQNSTQLKRYAGEMISKIDSLCKPYVKSIEGQFTDQNFEQAYQFIQENLPLFLNDEDYQLITKKLVKDSIRQITESNYKSLISPSGIISRTNILKDPLSLTFLGLKKLQGLNLSDDFTLEDGFITSKDAKHVLLFINPMLKANETDQNALFVSQLNSIKAELDRKHQVVSANYYGTLIISVANAAQIKKDIQLTVSIALSILFLILIFFYRKLLVPIVLFVPPFLGGLLAVACLFIFKGHVSAISLGIGAVLLGITLDYSLHLLTHLRNNADIKQLYKDVTKPILMSAITTAVAFMCLLFLESEALKDLGLFAAISVIAAAIMALICIPQFLKVNSDVKNRNTFIDHIAAFPMHRKKPLVFGLLILIVLAAFWIPKVQFDKDISKLNFLSDELKQTEDKLNELLNHSHKSLYAVSSGANLDESLVFNDKLSNQLAQWKSEGAIVSYHGISGLIHDQYVQHQRISKWNSFWELYREPLRANLIDEGSRLGFKEQSFAPFYDLMRQDFEPISLTSYQSLPMLNLEEFVNASDSSFVTVSTLIKVEKGKVNEIKAQLRDIDNLTIVDRQEMNETFLGTLRENFNKLIGFSFLAVVLMLWLFYGNFILMLVTLIPILLTWILSVGMMGILGIDFNIFNVIISTFIFGLGVDYSIFVTNGLLKDHSYGTKELITYKTSVLLSVITTVLAVGTLIFAHHPALRSISIVSLIGVLTAMIVSFVVQPVLFGGFISKRTAKGLAPLRIRKTISSIALSIFYALGGVFLSLFSISILPLIPISKKKKMGWLHRTMSRLVTATLYGDPFVKKEIHNPFKETFNKSAIIIANHSSALDTLTIGMVTSNVIYLVNDWVYKSPIFGLLARVAGFYPVSSGVDGSLDHLTKKIEQGYCLVVFPEARRSTSNKVGRFHKGAFHLANALKLDILPLYLHGNAEVMPKGDFVIYDGALVVHIGQRIAYDDVSFGTSERERTKGIARLFKENLLKIRGKNEGADYFKDKLLSNYHYKPDLLSGVKTDFQLNKEQYLHIEHLLTQNDRVGLILNDHGQLSILLKSKHQDRFVLCYYPDQAKQKIAQSCYTNRVKKVQYLTDLLLLKQEKINVLVIGILPENFDDLKDFLTLQIEDILLLTEVDHTKFLDLGYEIQSRTFNVVHLKMMK